MTTKSIKEITPAHFTDGFSRFKFPAGDHVVLVVMISNPDMCGACRAMEPEFEAAHKMAVERGVEGTLRFMYIHLNRPVWSRLPYADRQNALTLVAPHYANRYPEFSVVSRDAAGTLYSAQPFTNDAEGLFRSAVHRYGDIVNNVDQSVVRAISKWRPAGDNDAYYTEEDFNDEESDYSMVLSNFHDMKDLREDSTCGRHGGYCGGGY